MSILKDSLKTIILSVLTLLLVGIAYAWTEPTVSPPNSDPSVSKPITTSDTPQTKAGKLVIDSLGISNTASNALTVVGGVQVAGQIKITGGTPVAGEVLTSDGTGLATWEPVAGGGSHGQSNCYWTGYAEAPRTCASGYYMAGTYDNNVNWGHNIYCCQF